MKYWKEDGILEMENSNKLVWLKTANQSDWDKTEAARLQKIKNGKSKKKTTTTTPSPPPPTPEQIEAKAKEEAQAQRLEVSWRQWRI